MKSRNLSPQIRRLYVYGSDPIKWAKKHGVEPMTAPCQKCGKVQTTNLPMIFGTRYGLAINCECGSRVPYCIVIPNGTWKSGLTGEL